MTMLAVCLPVCAYVANTYRHEGVSDQTMATYWLFWSSVLQTISFSNESLDIGTVFISQD